METKHHYFFAVKLPKEMKDFLNGWIQSNQRDYEFGRWVHPEDYHITLAFLGYAEEKKLQDAIETMGSVLSDLSSFSLTLDKLGIFGSMKSPRIFWAGVVESEQLAEVQKKVFTQCLKLGFELDKKPFRPHITLARKYKGESFFNSEKLKSIKTEDHQTFEFEVSEVILYETHLDQSPKYKEFARFPLNAKNT
ncbi:RNA 2',3'-cyclic phosphodiesterase [Ureibacillus composti]|nr:RNA 2',3'-cyclic phosphodiesterase [Ureibacillus composti]